MRGRIPIGVTLLTLLFACSGDRSAPLAPNGAASENSPTISASTAAARSRELRRLVAPFHNFDKAVAAGWSAQITPCLVAADLPSQPGAGAMGFHYGKLAFIQDGGVVNLLQPELLLYEPEKNGKLRFVGRGVHRAVHRPSGDAAPPTLLGQSSRRCPSSASGGSTSGWAATTRAASSLPGTPR